MSALPQTEDECIDRMDRTVPFRGFVIAAVVVLLFLVAVACVVVRLKFIGKLTLDQAALGQRIVRYVALGFFFIMMCRNLNVAMGDVELCWVYITEALSGGYMKFFLVWNFIFFAVATGIAEYKRHQLEAMALFSDARAMAWTCGWVGLKKAAMLFALFMIRQAVLLVPAIFSPGFAILESIVLSRTCMLDAKASQMVVHAYIHSVMSLIVVVGLVVDVYRQCKGDQESGKYVFGSLAAAVFAASGIVMFFIQVVTSLSSPSLWKAYILSLGFIPLILGSMFFITMVLEILFLIQSTDAASYLLEITEPLVSMGRELRLTQNFPLATRSFRTAVIALSQLSGLSFNVDTMINNVDAHITPGAKAYANHHGITHDELQSIVLYTMETPVYPAVNTVLRTDRTKKNYEAVWTMKSKACILPFMYLVYAGLSKLPRILGDVSLFRGVRGIGAVESVTQPLEVVGATFHWSQLTSTSRDPAVALSFSGAPQLYNGVVFALGARQGRASYGRSLEPLSPIPEAETLFPSDLAMIVAQPITYDVTLNVSVATICEDPDNDRDVDFVDIMTACHEYRQWANNNIPQNYLPQQVQRLPNGPFSQLPGAVYSSNHRRE